MGREVRLKGRKGKKGEEGGSRKMGTIDRDGECRGQGRGAGERKRDRAWLEDGRVDEDLPMEERRMRWRMVEAAKKERVKEKRAVVTNRELRVEGRRWNWNIVGSCWKEERKMDRKVGDAVGRSHAPRSDRGERIERGYWEREENGDRMKSDRKDAWERGRRVEGVWKASRGESGQKEVGSSVKRERGEGGAGKGDAWERGYGTIGGCSEIVEKREREEAGQSEGGI